MHDFIDDIANAALGEWLEKRVREFVESNPRESYSSLMIMASQDAFVATELQLAEAHLLETYRLKPQNILAGISNLDTKTNCHASSNKKF